jgi:hypothetical protein
LGLSGAVDRTSNPKESIVKTLLFFAAAMLLLATPAVAFLDDPFGPDTCKACPSWRSPASSDPPPVVGSANFPEDVRRLRVCHLVKQRIGTHNGHAIYRTLQACR